MQHFFQKGDTDSAFINSTGLDNTIMIWRLYTASHSFAASDGGASQTDVPNEPNKQSQPLRRVLSKTDLSDLQRSLGQDTFTPTRSHHPSRLRKKASALALLKTPKSAAPCR